VTYTRVMALDELAVGTAAGVDVDGEAICVVRVDEQTVKAIHNVCSHEEYELSEGWVDDCSIECALHGSTFDLNTGKPETLPAVKPVPVYAARINDGAIEVDRQQQLNDAPIPRH
jgi:3-phenylpropionate/trans-cinnamate dioxygenase ferredoxin component